MNIINERRFIRLWLCIGIILVIIMIVIGGITRLTQSGLSIVEWKVISGTIPPLTNSQWQIAFEKYKEFPQYKKTNNGMSLSAFKSIFWWEYVHRLLGRIIGVVFIIPFIFLIRRKTVLPSLRKRLWIIFFLGILQGFIGWFMVKSGLVNIPHVSHFRLALHLTMALLLIAFMLWTLMDFKTDNFKNLKGHRGFQFFPFICLFALIIQIVLGAFIAGLKAGLYYNTYPLMGDSFFPDGLFDNLGYGILYNGVIIQFIHRWFAFVVFIMLIVFVIQIYANGPTKKIKAHAILLMLLLLTQIIIGITTLLLQVPVFLGVLHQLLAVMLFIVLIKMIYFHHYSPRVSVHI